MARISVNTPGRPERILNLEEGEAVLGRGGCDIRISDTGLSRRHCMLKRSGASCVVSDLGSSNGTRVNGTKIQSETSLVTGDLIEIGSTRVLYVADSAEDEEDDIISPEQTICLDGNDNVTTVEGKARYVLQYDKAGVKRVMTLGEDEVIIGRHSSCSLVFADGSVSSQHARVYNKDGVYIIEDIGSTNGIRVNGRPVKVAVLHPGTRVRIGRIVLGFKMLVSRTTAVGNESAFINEDTE